MFNPINPTTSINEFAVNGFPSTALQFVAGVSEPCVYYVGTSSGTVSLVSYESFGGGACTVGDNEQDPTHNDELGEEGDTENIDQVQNSDPSYDRTGATFGLDPEEIEFWAEDAASMVPCEENAVVWEADAERSEDESKNTLLEE